VNEREWKKHWSENFQTPHTWNDQVLEKATLALAERIAPQKQPLAHNPTFFFHLQPLPF